MSCAVTRTVCAARRTLPSSIAATLSWWPTVTMFGRSLKENDEARAATCRPLIWVSEWSSSSVRPSEKYSCSLSPLRFTNGNTAMKGGGSRAHEGCCTRWRPAGCRSLGRQQAPNSLNESRGWLACGEACPLRPRKRLWNLRGGFGSRVQANWQNEYTAASHHVGALVRKI